MTPVLRGWVSKLKFASGVTCAGAKAHFLDDDGVTACAKVPRATGQEMGPFTCTWQPHIADRDHLCAICKPIRDPEKICVCGSCRIEVRRG